MAKKKSKTSKKKNIKVNKVNLVLLIIFFIAVSSIIFYFVSLSNNIVDIKLSPINISRKQEQKKDIEIKKTDDDKIITKEIPVKHIEPESLQVIHDKLIEPTTKDTPASEPLPAPTIRDKAKMYVINPNLPKICIIVDDFGTITNTLFDRFNSLDTEINFAILPGHNNSRLQMNKAIEAGREVLIHIPMEPDMSDGKIKNKDLESVTIKSSMTDFEIKDYIETWMFELFLASGANNHMGSKATRDSRVMKIVLETLLQNDMYFIDSFTDSKSVALKIANEVGIKSARRNIFLDVPESSMANARKKITEIKKIKNQDVVVVISHCHNDIKYRQLIHFIDKLKDEGYQLIPASLAVR